MRPATCIAVVPADSVLAVGWGLPLHVAGEQVEHLGCATIAQRGCLWSVDAVEVGALLGPGQRGGVAAFGELDGRP